MVKAITSPAATLQAPAAAPLHKDPFWLGCSEEDGEQFAETFTLTTPAAERKRPVGQPTRYKEHRQKQSGKNAINAGYQMKRGLVEPAFGTELEPGEAAKQALATVHPFNKDVSLPQQLLDNIDKVCSNPEEVVANRLMLSKLWKARAEELQAG